MTPLLVSVFLALMVSAMCSLLEAAVLSLTPSQVALLSGRYPRRGAIWRSFKTHIDRPVAVILVLNTAAHTVGATLAGAHFELLFGDRGLVLFSLGFTYVMLQFTEILPKTLGVRYNRRLAPLIAFPLDFLMRALAPVVFVVHQVNRLFEPRRGREQAPTTLEEITALAGLARLSNLIGPHQERIIAGAARLSQKTVRDVMIPSDHVVFLSAAGSLTAAVDAALADLHTRFPVCEGDDRDRVAGYVNLKEMVQRLRTHPEDPDLRSILRPVHFVSPDRPASELLRDFIERHEHMAIVLKDGRTLGLVTLEDLIEELVGELEDEFDRLPRAFHALGDGTLRVGGGVPISEVADRLGVSLPEARGTLSDWLLLRLGRPPRTGQTHHEVGAAFEIRRTRRGKIIEVSVAAPRRPGTA
jgi:CBS domain containing-hemolysin-like protein